MNWKFWEKNKSNTGVKLTKPKDLPQSVGKHLVVDLKYDPDWVWGLKIVYIGKIEKEENKNLFDFRIFDPNHAMTKGIEVKNYRALDEHVDMILFDGWYNKRTEDMKTNDHYSSLKAKIPA